MVNVKFLRDVQGERKPALERCGWLEKSTVVGVPDAYASRRMR